jgi:hypothetical protein
MQTRLGAPNILIMFRGIFWGVRCAIIIGAWGIGAQLVLADCKSDDRVRCASPIGMPTQIMCLYMAETETDGKEDDEE